MQGSASMIGVCNDMVLAQINRKQPKSTHFKQNTIFDSFVTMIDGFELFVDIKTDRIKKILQDLNTLKPNSQR